VSHHSVGGENVIAVSFAEDAPLHGLAPALPGRPGMTNIALRQAASSDASRAGP